MGRQEGKTRGQDLLKFQKYYLIQSFPDIKSYRGTKFLIKIYLVHPIIFYS